MLFAIGAAATANDLQRLPEPTYLVTTAEPPAKPIVVGVAGVGETRDGLSQDQFNSKFEKARNDRYPNLQLNGDFQADAGFFQQDATSIASFGQIQDGAAFRRARLSATGSVSETV